MWMRRDVVMVKIEVPDQKHFDYLVKGLEVLSQQLYQSQNYTMTEILEISIFHKFLDDTSKKLYEPKDNLPETLSREPNKGERTVLGRPSYVKDTS